MKFGYVSFFRWFELFNKYAAPSNSKTESKVQELKLKKPNQLQEVLDIARYLLQEIAKSTSTNNDGERQIAEPKGTLEQVKTVLEM